MSAGDPAPALPPESAGPARSSTLFRLTLLALAIGQMTVYYDTAVKTIPQINLYLLGNLLLIVAVLLPWRALPPLLWGLVWPIGAALRWDWAVRPTNSDVFWATSQGVDFLLHGLNPYTQIPTWVYQHQPAIRNYPTYSYFPGGLFSEIPFYLLGNVRYGLALADLGTALLLYLLARPRLGVWPARAGTAAWLLFIPGFQVGLLLGTLDFLLLFWIALAVWLYSREHLVASAFAAAMVFSTKQYGFVFAVPWELLLLRPLVDEVLARGRARVAGGLRLRGLPRRLWLPPLGAAAAAAVIVLPLALLSPQAFFDSTVGQHASRGPDPMLGTPQWNESLAAQLVALHWLPYDSAAALAGIAFPVALLLVLGIAASKVRDMATATGAAALAAGVTFALNKVPVQFFYWRLALLLFALYFIVSQRPISTAWAAGRPGSRRPGSHDVPVPPAAPADDL